MISGLLGSISERKSAPLDMDLPKCMGGCEQTAPTQSTVGDVYLQAILREGSRTLGLMDREPLSPTLGCMDRTYWAWKFTDFPGARFQEGLYALSFLHETQFPGNPYFAKPKLLQWIDNGINYWCTIQYPGGDFDEAYPYERSLAATAFTTFYLAETWTLVGGKLPATTTECFLQAIRKSGEWLCKNDETHGFLSNHLAAAAAALAHCAHLVREERYLERSHYFWKKILEHQSTEGWYEEYGGADPGYQTHGSFYLARYWQLTNDDKVVDSLERSFKFLAHFIHPDGSVGGEYASRNTQTYYPAAFEMMSGLSGTAHWIADRMLPSVNSLSAAGLGTVDSYNYFPLLNNYAFAYLACGEPSHRKTMPEGPDGEVGTWHFPEAGIIKLRTPKNDLYVGTHKGGVVKLFDRIQKQIVLNDCGYLGCLQTGKLISTQWVDKHRKVTVDGGKIIVEGDFFQFSKPVMQPLRFVLFRIFTLTAGRIPGVSYWLKSLLVNALIYKSKRLPIQFQRTIQLTESQFQVTDQLVQTGECAVDRILHSDLFTTIHMGSSRYFIPNELLPVDEESLIPIDREKLFDGVTKTRIALLYD